jgi:signal transduction histidine kinase
MFGQRAGWKSSVPKTDAATTDFDGCELALYRVAQEALTNAVRHGQASRVTVFVQRTSTGVMITVRDNGQGFDAENWQKRCLAGQHLGLLGIEERVTLLGGSFCLESKPGVGTTLYAEIPVKETP